MGLRSCSWICILHLCKGLALPCQQRETPCTDWEIVGVKAHSWDLRSQEETWHGSCKYWETCGISLFIFESFWIDSTSEEYSGLVSRLEWAFCLTAWCSCVAWLLTDGMLHSNSLLTFFPTRGTYLGVFQLQLVNPASVLSWTRGLWVLFPSVTHWSGIWQHPQEELEVEMLPAIVSWHKVTLHSPEEAKIITWVWF